jgi:small nuclear ribonucleoprotein (snRNP)-like protein
MTDRTITVDEIHRTGEWITVAKTYTYKEIREIFEGGDCLVLQLLNRVEELEGVLEKVQLQMNMYLQHDKLKELIDDIL